MKTIKSVIKRGATKIRYGWVGNLKSRRFDGQTYRFYRTTLGKNFDQYVGSELRNNGWNYRTIPTRVRGGQSSVYIDVYVRRSKIQPKKNRDLL